MHKNHKYTAWENEAEAAFKTQKWLNFKKPVEVQYTYFFGTLHKRDIDNYVKPLSDFLVKVGVFKDDNIDFIKKYTIEFGGIDRGNPRVEINIQEVSC